MYFVKIDEFPLQKLKKRVKFRAMWQNGCHFWYSFYYPYNKYKAVMMRPMKKSWSPVQTQLDPNNIFFHHFWMKSWNFLLVVSSHCAFHDITYSLFQISIYPHFYKSKSLFLRNHSKYQNMQYTIEKPYKMVTKNDRKILKFSTFVRFLGPFLKKRCFSKIGNF